MPGCALGVTRPAALLAQWHFGRQTAAALVSLLASCLALTCDHLAATLLQSLLEMLACSSVLSPIIDLVIIGNNDIVIIGNNECNNR